MIPCNTGLLPHEWNKLSEFGLIDGRFTSPLSVETTTLLNDDSCLTLLRHIQTELGAPDVKVTASLVLKRIAFLTLAPMLYAMSCYDKGLDVSIENCHFEYPLKNRFWQSRMPLKNRQVWCSSDNRDVWREMLLANAFRGNLSLLVNQLHRLTRVQKAVLWENIAVRIFSIYENRIFPDLSGREIVATAHSDLSYLLAPETRELFGLSSNPLSRYFYEKSIPESTAEPIRVRRTCCYYYRATEPTQFCRNCPLRCKKRRR